MALMTTLLKSILNGSKTPAPTHGEMKGALGTVYDFTTEMLGTDSANKASAREILGVLDSAGLRNLLYNPTFLVNQRGWVQNFPVYVSVNWSSPAPNPYFCDRWRAAAPSQTYPATSFGSYQQITIPSIGTMYQHVPGEDIVGGTYQLVWQGTATATVNDVAVINGGKFTLPANTNAKIAFGPGTLARPQLELGACRAWEPRPLPLELMLCQTFYEKAVTPQGIYISASSSTAVRYTVRKRTVPTVSLGIASPNAVTLVTNNLTQSGNTQFVVSASTGGATNFIWTADAEIYE